MFCCCCLYFNQLHSFHHPLQGWTQTGCLGGGGGGGGISLLSSRCLLRFTCGGGGGGGGGAAQQLHAKTAQCSEKQQSSCQGGGGFKFEKKKMLEKQEKNGHRFPCILYFFHSPPNQPTYFISKRCLKMLTNGRQTDARVIGILLAHLGVFGGGGLWVRHCFGSSFFLVEDV